MLVNVDQAKSFHRALKFAFLACSQHCFEYCVQNYFFSIATCPYKPLLSLFHTPHPYEATSKRY